MQIWISYSLFSGHQLHSLHACIDRRSGRITPLLPPTAPKGGMMKERSGLLSVDLD